MSLNPSLHSSPESSSLINNTFPSAQTRCPHRMFHTIWNTEISSCALRILYAIGVIIFHILTLCLPLLFHHICSHDLCSCCTIRIISTTPSSTISPKRIRKKIPPHIPKQFPSKKIEKEKIPSPIPLPTISPKHPFLLPSIKKEIISLMPDFATLIAQQNHLTDMKIFYSDMENMRLKFVNKTCPPNALPTIVDSSSQQTIINLDCLGSYPHTILDNIDIEGLPQPKIPSLVEGIRREDLVTSQKGISAEMLAARQQLRYLSNNFWICQNTSPDSSFACAFATSWLMSLSYRMSSGERDIFVKEALRILKNQAFLQTSPRHASLIKQVASLLLTAGVYGNPAAIMKNIIINKEYMLLLSDYIRLSCSLINQKNASDDEIIEQVLTCRNEDLTSTISSLQKNSTFTTLLLQELSRPSTLSSPQYLNSKQFLKQIFRCPGYWRNIKTPLGIFMRGLLNSAIESTVFAPDTELYSLFKEALDAVMSSHLADAYKQFCATYQNPRTEASQAMRLFCFLQNHIYLFKSPTPHTTCRNFLTAFTPLATAAGLEFLKAEKTDSTRSHVRTLLSQHAFVEQALTMHELYESILSNPLSIAKPNRHLLHFFKTYSVYLDKEILATSQGKTELPPADYPHAAAPTSPTKSDAFVPLDLNLAVDDVDAAPVSPQPPAVSTVMRLGKISSSDYTKYEEACASYIPHCPLPHFVENFNTFCQTKLIRTLLPARQLFIFLTQNKSLLATDQTLNGWYKLAFRLHNYAMTSSVGLIDSASSDISNTLGILMQGAPFAFLDHPLPTNPREQKAKIWTYLISHLEQSFSVLPVQNFVLHYQPLLSQILALSPHNDDLYKQAKDFLETDSHHKQLLQTYLNVHSSAVSKILRKDSFLSMKASEPLLFFLFLKAHPTVLRNEASNMLPNAVVLFLTHYENLYENALTKMSWDNWDPIYSEVILPVMQQANQSYQSMLLRLTSLPAFRQRLYTFFANTPSQIPLLRTALIKFSTSINAESPKTLQKFHHQHPFALCLGKWSITNSANRILAEDSEISSHFLTGNFELPNPTAPLNIILLRSHREYFSLIPFPEKPEDSSLPNPLKNLKNPRK